MHSTGNGPDHTNRAITRIPAVAALPSASASMASASAAAPDDLDAWEWPEEAQRSTYYVPSRIATSEPPAPMPAPKLLRKTAAAAAPSASGRVTSISDYAFSDEGAHVKVYLAVPGVVRERVTCEIREDQVDLRAEGTPTGTHVLALRRLYDRVYTPGSSFKVQEGHGRVVLLLCKMPAPDREEVKTWLSNLALDLSQYSGTFAADGWLTLGLVAKMGADDLRAAGVTKRGHAVLLQDGVAELR